MCVSMCVQSAGHFDYIPFVHSILFQLKLKYNFWKILLVFRLRVFNSNYDAAGV